MNKAEDKQGSARKTHRAVTDLSIPDNKWKLGQWPMDLPLMSFRENILGFTKKAGDVSNMAFPGSCYTRCDRRRRRRRPSSRNLSTALLSADICRRRYCNSHPGFSPGTLDRLTGLSPRL
jgi:hypothetical protein